MNYQRFELTCFLLQSTFFSSESEFEQLKVAEHDEQIESVGELKQP